MKRHAALLAVISDAATSAEIMRIAGEAAVHSAITIIQIAQRSYYHLVRCVSCCVYHIPLATKTPPSPEEF